MIFTSNGDNGPPYGAPLELFTFELIIDKPSSQVTFNQF